MREIKDLLAEHPMFQGLDPKHLELLGGCGKNVVFEAGDQLLKEGDPAVHFYVLRSGRVSIKIHSAERGPLAIQTLEEGDVVGWSWLIPPYKWHFDAVAITLTRAVALDAECLRGKCEQDTRLGYELLKRFTGVMTDRLKATRLQLLDLYGVHS